MEASTLLNIDDSYIGDMTSQSLGKTTTYSNVASKVFQLPEDMPITEKAERIKEYNKQQGKTKLISMHRDRPKLSDMEIALVVASAAHTPYDILSHVLNISQLKLRRTVTQYSHLAIPQMPLVMISDTSRYWDKDTIRDTDDISKLNNPLDPLTSKELLRGPGVSPYKSEVFKERVFAGSHGEHVSSNLINTSYSEDKSLEVYFKYPESTDRSKYVAPYSVRVGWSKIVVGNVLNYTTVQNNMSALSKYFNVEPTKNKQIMVASNLARAIYKLVDIDQFEAHTLPNGNVMVYNNRLADTYLSTVYATRGTNTLIRAASIKFNKYDSSTSTHYTFAPYNFVRPHLFDRAHAAPIKTTNNELRYRVPSNLNFSAIKYSDYMPKVRLSVRCNVCTKVLTHVGTKETLRCNCTDSIIVTYSTVRRYRTNNTQAHTFPKLSYPLVSQDVIDFYKYYKHNKSLNNKYQYKYHKVNTYTEGEREDIKQVVSIYTTHDNYSLLLEDKDVKLLYTNFKVPFDATLSEPSHL